MAVVTPSVNSAVAGGQRIHTVSAMRSSTPTDGKHRVFSGAVTEMVQYAGYRFSTAGISVWPKRTLKHSWQYLAMITTQLSPDRKQWITSMVFSIGGSLNLRTAKGTHFGDAMGRYAEALAIACANAPPAAEIDEQTVEIACWGPRAVRRRIKSISTRMAPVEELLAKARHHRVRLEFKPALKAIESALHQQGDHREALELRVKVLAESGAKSDKLLRAAAQWVSLHPRDEEARRIHLLLRLQSRDPVAAEEATAWLARNPDQPELVDALAAFYFQSGGYETAARLWDTLARTTADRKLAKLAESNATYLRQYDASAWFRCKEQLKHWGRLVLVWSPLILFFGVQGLVVYHRHWSEREHREMMEQIQREVEPRREEIRQNMAEVERRYTERTGMILGDYNSIKARAENGEPAAQYTLADMLFAGRQGAPKDPGLALEYLEKAVAQTHRAAVLSLAERLDEGDEVPADRPRAITLYEKAIELGSPRAARILGEHFKSGEVVPRDETRAFQYFELSAAGGNTHAMNLAGWALEHGEGVETDMIRALEYYRQAAEARSLWAQERLVVLLGNSKGPHFSKDEAWKWLMRGAEQGSDRLRYMAATRAHNVDDLRPEEEKKVVLWLREMAESGQPAAAHILGQIILHGHLQPYDPARAFAWFVKAADKGYAISIGQLATIHAFGVGTARDIQKATELRERLGSIPDVDISILERTDRGLAAATQPLPEASERDLPMRPLWQPQPRYPIRLRRADLEGEVVVRFKLDEEGFARELQTVSASHPDFVPAALAAVSYWRFVPGRKDGLPIYGTLQQTISFQINDDLTKDPGE